MSNITLFFIPQSLPQHSQSNISDYNKRTIFKWNQKEKMNAKIDSLLQTNLETQSPRLDLSNQSLTTLPEQLQSFTHLTHLDLSHNQLTTLPEWINQLTALTHLNCAHNQLTTLPETFCELPQLHTLDLTQNQLTELPEAFGQLTTLYSLEISQNQLTQMPESFYKLNKKIFHRKHMSLTYKNNFTITETIKLVFYGFL